MLMRKGIVCAGVALVLLAVAFGALGSGGSPPARANELVVTKVADTNDGTCNADCSLREAISLVIGGDTISFAIPGEGPHFVQPLTNLPFIAADAVTIDGYTQPGASANTATAFQPTNADIRIVIDGSLNTDIGGFGLWIQQPGATIRGLSIVNADQEGIKTSTLIGGVSIIGNFIGILPDGETAAPNGVGVELRSSSPGNIIGGVAAADRNVISGNTGDGVWVDGFTAVVVAGNFVGTNAAGDAAVPNATGIHLDPGTGSTVGGNSTGTGNLVSGNTIDGISLTQPDAANINVKANRIGTTADGASPLGNGRHGVYLAQGAHDTTIGGEFNAAEQNIIAFNGDAAIGLASTAGANNYIDPNIIHSNGGLGADLGEDGVTLNDPLDSDRDGAGIGGPNNLMNFPDISSATYDGTTLVINGSLSSIPNKLRLMFVFSNSECDPSGYGANTFLRQ